MNSFADAQPENVLVLKRRQRPRDSPSSTIESGRTIPTIADLLLASARTFTHVVALADTSSGEAALEAGPGFSAAVLVRSAVVLVAALGAGIAASRNRVSVAIPGRTFARCGEGVADDGNTATEARRSTGAGRSVIALGAGDGGLLAGRNCHAPQLATMVRTAPIAFPVHRGIGARATAGHQRQPSREAG